MRQKTSLTMKKKREWEREIGKKGFDEFVGGIECCFYN